jgi:hypothetical protein
VALALAACTLFPLVPDPLTREPRIDLAGSPGILLVAGGLELTVRLTEVPGAGVLAARWFDPDGRAVLESRRAVTPGDAGRTVYFTGPAGPRPGRWRAVVLLDAVVVRQFAIQVSAP